jgi:hypothetical protein
MGDNKIAVEQYKKKWKRKKPAAVIKIEIFYILK